MFLAPRRYDLIHSALVSSLFKSLSMPVPNSSAFACCPSRFALSILLPIPIFLCLLSFNVAYILDILLIEAILPYAKM